jgi:hypothetical protein
MFVLLMSTQQPKTARSRLKQVLMAALLFMMTGTAMELYLLDHYEDTLQLIPLLCIGAALLLVVVLWFRRTAVLLGIFQLVLGLTALSGLYGAFLHLRANYEFELEMKPTLSGWALFAESLSGALPALAPGSMIVLALMGYAYLLLIQKPIQ